MRASIVAAAALVSATPIAAQVRDTTWVFNVANVSWTKAYFAATIGASWPDSTGAPSRCGTTTAPDSADARRWTACIGASISMREPTLTLRNARGVVHLHTDLRPLTEAARSTRDSASQPRRLP